MSKAIVGIASTSIEIQKAVDELQTLALVPVKNISILIPDHEGTPNLGAVNSTKVPEGATVGGVAGGITGGALGVLVGIGALAIPGLGAFIAAGPLLAGLSGAAAGMTLGGFAGALVGAGIPEYEAKAYEEHLVNGGFLIAVHVPNVEVASEVRAVLMRNGFTDISKVAED